MILNFAVHITKPEKEATKQFDKPTIGVVQSEPNMFEFSKTSFYENSDLFKAPKEDNSQSNIVIGISVCIAVISFVAMFLLMINIVNKKKNKEILSNQVISPQFKIVPINRSNLKPSRFQPPSNFNDLTGCFQTDAKDTSIQVFDFTDFTEFDYYDYTNNRVESCHGNGGTLVHV